MQTEKQESLADGVASSGLARRRGLNWESGIGFYFTSRRLIIIQAKTSTSLKWNPGAGSLFGSVGAKVTPFIDTASQSVDGLDKSKKLFESQLEEIVEIDVKSPGKIWGKGHVTVRLSSGKRYSLALIDDYDDYGKEVFDFLVNLLLKQLPEKIKISE
jgi:hypothetical protein